MFSAVAFCNSIEERGIIVHGKHSLDFQNVFQIYSETFPIVSLLLHLQVLLHCRSATSGKVK